MIFAAAGLLMALAASSPLAAYRGHDRVLVISAPAVADAALKRQDEALADEAAGLKERDFVVIRAVAQKAQDSRGHALDAAAVRRQVDLAADRFGVALVGKDGHTVFHRTEVLEPAELFRTVDAMPMRRAEMKARPR